MGKSKVLSAVTSQMLSKGTQKVLVKQRTKQILKENKEVNKHNKRVARAERMKSDVMSCLDTTGHTIGGGYEI